MTTPTDRSEPLSGPTAQQLADAAHLRAWGHDWESVGAAVRCEWLALRRAAGADPGFAAALAREDAAATREGEAKALRRLRALTESDDPKVALRASEVLVRYARERRREAGATSDPLRTTAEARPAQRPGEKGETAEKESIRVPRGLLAVPPAPPAFRAVPLSAGRGRRDGR